MAPLTEDQKEYQREYRQRPERVVAMREHRKRWKQEHREQSNAIEVRRHNERYATDPEYRERMKKKAKAAYNIKAHRLRTYGLSHEQFVEMYSRQNGRCDVCREEILPEGKRTHVDHDHETGKVRALLCHGCNAGLGLLKEDPERMRSLAAYVERHREGGDAQ